jgi:hypothetical protein
MDFVETLHESSEFYLLLGTASGAFVALLFVSISIGVGFFTDRNIAGTRTFSSPVVIHFTAVMFVSALAMAPTHVPWLFPVMLALTGLVGTGIGIVTTINVTRFENKRCITPFDHFAYGAIPLFAYTVLVLVAWLFVIGWPWARELMAGALLLLLIINIRNTWDLLLTVVRRQSKRP